MSTSLTTYEYVCSLINANKDVPEQEVILLLEEFRQCESKLLTLLTLQEQGEAELSTLRAAIMKQGIKTLVGKEDDLNDTKNLCVLCGAQAYWNKDMEHKSDCLIVACQQDTLPPTGITQTPQGTYYPGTLTMEGSQVSYVPPTPCRCQVYRTALQEIYDHEIYGTNGPRLEMSDWADEVELLRDIADHALGELEGEK